MVIVFEKFINNLLSVLLLIISCLHGRASRCFTKRVNLKYLRRLLLGNTKDILSIKNLLQ